MKEITNPGPELIERANTIGKFLATAIGTCSLPLPPNVKFLNIMVHYDDGVVLEVLTEPIGNLPTGQTTVVSPKKDGWSN